MEQSHMNLWIPVVLQRIFIVVAFPVDESVHAVVMHSSTSRKPRQGHQHLKPHYWHKGITTDSTIPLVTTIHCKGWRTKAIGDEFSEIWKRHSERNPNLKALCPDIPTQHNPAEQQWQPELLRPGLDVFLTEADKSNLVSMKSSRVL